MMTISKGDIDAVKALPGLWINPEQAAGFIGVNPQSIREQARTDPRALGFPVSVMGTRVLIPKAPFLRFWAGEATP